MFGIELIDAGLLPAMLVALVAGVISFLSPCVLPIVPPYLAYMSGVSLNEMSGGDEARRKAVLAALCFVMGLSTVFLILGFTASIFGAFFLQNQEVIAILSGLIIYTFGLHFFGLNRAIFVFLCVIVGLTVVFSWMALYQTEGFAAYLFGSFFALRYELSALLIVSVLAQLLPFDRFPFLDQEARLDAGDKGGSSFGAYVLGLAFAFGWTPCIGPQLGAILTLAASEASVTKGTLLLGIYAAGLGIPFVLAAMFITRAMGVMNRLKRHMTTIERVMGGLLVLVGVMMVTGAFTSLAFWLLETFPVLGLLG